MLVNILAIAKNTLRETLRDRILLSAWFVGVAIILFSLFIASISLDQSSRIILNFGVNAIYILQIFIAIFIGSMLMYKEIERKTFYLLLPKPISRTDVIIGKCLGLTGTTFIVSFISLIVLMIIMFIYGDSNFILPTLLSVLLSGIEFIILILISIFFSTITSPVIASISTVVIFFVSHAQDIFRFIFMTTKTTFIEIISKIIYYILPNLEKFNIRNDIVYGTMPNNSQILLSIIYGLAYIILLILITSITFKKKDF